MKTTTLEKLLKTIGKKIPTRCMTAAELEEWVEFILNWSSITCRDGDKITLLSGDCIGISTETSQKEIAEPKYLLFSWGYVSPCVSTVYNNRFKPQKTQPQHDGVWYMTSYDTLKDLEWGICTNSVFLDSVNRTAPVVVAIDGVVRNYKYHQMSDFAMHDQIIEWLDFTPYTIKNNKTNTYLCLQSRQLVQDNLIEMFKQGELGNVELYNDVDLQTINFRVSSTDVHNSRKKTQEPWYYCELDFETYDDEDDEE